MDKAHGRVLLVTGGGTMTMGPNITGISNVSLANAASSYAFTANAISGLVITDLNQRADTMTAGAAGQTLVSGATAGDTLIGFGSGVSTFRSTAAGLNGDIIRNYSAQDRIGFSDVAFGAGTTVAYTATNSTQGSLTISVNGVQRAQVNLFGQLMGASFATQSDGGTGTVVVMQPQVQALLALPGAT